MFKIVENNETLLHMRLFVGTARLFFLCFCASIWGFTCFSQETISWERLQDVQFESDYNEETLEMLWFAKFGQSVKELDGKTITITGYVIPFRKDQNLYALSAYPFAACFFCGNAGPESVIEIKLIDSDVTFSMDQVATITGILRLNANDPYQLNYWLESARVVEE